MTPKELKEMMCKYRLNVKKTAAMLHVSGRCVYSWLDGSRAMPALAWEHLLLKVGDRG